ncbi:NAD-dependent epimerase/dehydratase family protein [Solibacillus sp. FSL K6-4121]|uniref:NAD-dependent epimerase/dehydratase family protein n=1 Tax=Solibacillus sp. FSL K6-4121 TaxID=2921505 RepID=UPI0030FA94ED
MILVIGGAGYIGSHVVNRLVETERVVVYDNLSTGCREAVNEQAIFIEGELVDEKRLTQVFSLFPIKTVVHLAAASVEVESNENPQLYYENNVTAMLVLLKVMRAHHVKNIVYSSTALTSSPANEPLNEQSYIETTNPYARSKYFSEQILQDYTMAYKMNCIVLRYLNGSGTQIEDLVNAYSMALETVAKNERSFKIYNLGNGQDYSVKETKEKETITKSDSHIEDTPVFIASLQKIQQELGLYAEKNLQRLISDTWNGHQIKNFNF